MEEANYDGFLGSEMESWIKKYRKENKELFSFCYELNQVAHKTLSKLIIHNKDGQEILSSAMFTRILSQYQSVIVLVERGMINEAKIILRTMLDGLFILVAMTKDRKYMNYYINDDIEKRKGSLNQFSKNPGDHFSELKEQLPEEEIAKLLQELSEEKASKELEGVKYTSRISTKKWAEFAELEHLYYKVYSLLNSAVHGLSRELEQYAEIDDDGEIVGMNSGPCIEGIGIALTTASDFLIIVLMNIHDFFELDKLELEKLHMRNNEIPINSDDMRIIPMSQCVNQETESIRV